MSDNITLPREVVERVETLMKIANRWEDDVDILVSTIVDLRDDLTDLRAALAAPKHKHPGYVIGSHWLETAYSRICAGEAEADVLRDCGWERVDEALRRDAERWRQALESIAANACCDRCQEAALVAKAALRGEDKT